MLLHVNKEFAVEPDDTDLELLEYFTVPIAVCQSVVLK